ncbi:MAG: helicase-related protein [Chitinophagaceae bacterium]|nr:helicase-related protein [Chitinophagaceae bacterium]
MPSKILDNSSEQYQLKTFFKDLLKSGYYSEIAVATGYWDLPAIVEIFDELSIFLQKPGVSFRLLLGEEPSVKSYQVKKPSQVDPDFPQKYLKKDLEDLDLKPEFQKVVSLLAQHLVKDETGHAKFQIKVYRKDFLHAKCYLFGSEQENAIGIIGSSNFTQKGLSGNLELNALEDSNATVNYRRLNINQHPSHRSWFEELWKESDDWNMFFKEELLDVSKHGNICFSPYEMYIHALYRVYSNDLQDEKESIILPDDPAANKPQLLTFQVQNANSLIKKLERQGVAMLSDSVGLGKTYTAIKVIEYYRQVKNQRVVVITPAGLKPQWEKAFAEFQFLHIPEILSLQDVKKIEERRETYRTIPVGLFVFDESHNLRNSGGGRFDVFINWKMENENAHTLLLTATPINNQLADLTNQVMLGTGGEIRRLGSFLNDRGNLETLKERLDLIQKNIKAQIKEGIVDYPSLREQLTPLLNKFIVKRTRQSIEKDFPEGLLINGKPQKFPKSIPDNLEYEVSNQYKSELFKIAATYPLLTKAFEYSVNSLAQLEYLAHPLDLFQQYEKREEPIHSSLEIVYTGLLALGFPCYRYNIYRHAYYNRYNGKDEAKKPLKLSVDENRELSRQIGIYGIFRTVFLKRLESSMKAIQHSIVNYENKLIDFKTKLEQFNKIVSVKNLTALNKAIDAYNEQNADEDELDFDIDSFETTEEGFVSITADTGTFNVAQLKEDIDKDLAIIHVLKKQVEFLTRKDDKMQVLAKHLNQNDDRKVLIFTYFADTLQYLKDELPKFLIKGKNAEFALGTKADIENYANRFAPVSKKYQLKPGEKEIDYLVATDKLSEGQNLQDCGMIVNYDLHWNPVRMIQRNGRINRLGSEFDEIFIYNFRPTEQLENYLQLVNKLQSKIDLIRYTIGTDQSILNEQPIPQDFTEDLYSRDEKKRLAAFQKIFETSELLAAEDLFMDDLREFDRSEKFNAAYKEKIKNLPKGKWGKIQMRKEEDNYIHLAHVASGEDDELEAGYFLAFGAEQVGELLSTTEGLLSIKATSEQNQRFKDNFRNKATAEAYINNFIRSFQFSEDEYNVRYNKQQENAIALLIATMMDYGYAEKDVEMVTNAVLHSQNAYINKENLRLVKEVNRKNRRGEPIRSELIDRFLALASQHRPDDPSGRLQLSEIIQIFA